LSGGFELQFLFVANLYIAVADTSKTNNIAAAIVVAEPQIKTI